MSCPSSRASAHRPRHGSACAPPRPTRPLCRACGRSASARAGPRSSRTRSRRARSRARCASRSSRCRSRCRRRRSPGSRSRCVIVATAVDHLAVRDQTGVRQARARAADTAKPLMKVSAKPARSISRAESASKQHGITPDAGAREQRAQLRGRTQNRGRHDGSLRARHHRAPGSPPTTRVALPTRKPRLQPSDRLALRVPAVAGEDVGCSSCSLPSPPSPAWPPPHSAAAWRGERAHRVALAGGGRVAARAGRGGARRRGGEVRGAPRAGR